MHKNKIVLITGGTGSFGNAVAKKLLKLQVKELRIFSRDELKQEEMRHKFSNEKLKFFLGDIRDKNSIDRVIKNVDYVFHAAALKQVPSCEFYPSEAIKTNIIGSENIIDLSIKNKQVILPSIDVELFKKLDKEKNKFKDSPFVQDRKKIIGYLGRFEKEMGLLVFLDLINKPELKNNKFLIIGASGALSGYTKSRADKHKDRVIVYSDVSEKKLPHLLKLCDVLIVPSINERACYGKAIAEGQSCGVPVIASNLGGHKEVIENNHTGMFFEPNNSDDLKDKINYLIDDCELRNEIINNGLKKSPQYSNHIKLKYNFEVYKGALQR